MPISLHARRAKCPALRSRLPDYVREDLVSLSYLLDSRRIARVARQQYSARILPPKQHKLRR